jgi:uncharacterized protein (TIGR03083 family)
VPTCPDFTVDELAHHVGTFCAFWTHVLCEGTARPKTPFRQFEVDDGGVADPHARAAWVAELGRSLVDELRATEPNTPVWTWYPPDQHAGFVARRCSHELSVHRVDMQLARGDADPVDALLAADGIEEIFVLAEFGGSHVPPEAGGSGQTLHLHGTDVADAEWLLTLGGERIDVERIHAKGDLALRGAVSDLEMLLYQRPPVGTVERFGDDAVLDAFHRAFTFG